MGWTIIGIVAHLLWAAAALALAVTIVWAVRQANRRHSGITQRCPLSPMTGVQCARTADHTGLCLVSRQDVFMAGYYHTPF